ncbi:RNA polymerase sigma factor [Plantactinospora sonchi]|uniref:RNA polymerase sigma factor n=1 Tax=Plantactinospora sonchi TaxID=1544735 RepID=A0ABU7RNU5_9ACTN
MTRQSRAAVAGAEHAGDGRLDLTRLFERSAGELLRYCASRVGQAAAEDVVAQTFLTAVEQQRRYDRRHDDPRPWLFGIATNLLRQHRRAEVRGLRAMARTGIDPLVADGLAERTAESVDARVTTRRIVGALARLPARQRDVLLLYAIAELSYAEIAAALVIPVGSVQSALHRARTKLRAELRHEPRGPNHE